jgi:hypothetical protein
MLSPKERELLTDIQDRLLELYVRYDDANRAADRAQLQAIEREIAAAETQRAELRRWEMASAA